MSDWNYYVLSWDYIDLTLAGWPSWELQDETPYSVVFESTQGRGKQPRDIAVEWDDIATHDFHWDWTKSGIPIVRDGDVYWSKFSFQKVTQAKLFQEMYGGCGSWEDRYKEVMERYRTRQTGEKE